MTISN